MSGPGCVVATLLLVPLFAACGGRLPYRVPSADPDTLRQLSSGDVVGGRGRYDSLAWLGIPYAKPPVGELRWRAPEPAEPWPGTRQALAFGAPCPQYGSRFGGAPRVRPGRVGGTEDCLTLNVWTPPAAAAQQNLPVFVWIHGGGDTIGHAAFYDGGNLAAAQGLVVVTVQYRLGPFGFFRHPALRARARSDAEASGNFGLLDLVRALDWVRQNAAAFGGDPGNVTIAGESAGAMNVCALLLTPEARGLFHRAVVESGGLWFNEPTDSEHALTDAVPGSPQGPVEISLRLAQRDGLAADRAGALAGLGTMSADEVGTWLRGHPANDILAAYHPMPNGMIEMPRIVRDGTVIPTGDPLARLAQPDGWNRVPVLIGSNRDENKLFMFSEPALVRRLLWIIPRLVDEPTYQINAEYLARLWKAAGADGPASAMIGTESHVFVYRFDWKDQPTVLGADLGKMLGAAHAFEIPFVFGHFDLGREASVMYTRANEPGRLALSRAMMSYWAEFAHGGAPERGRQGKLPAWQPWDDGRFMILDSERGGGVRMASGVETRERVLADVSADPRLPTPLQRCRLIRALAEWGHGLTRAEYARRPDCAAFPYDAFPWTDRR
jgi:para-nitrobenzyl esterase